MKYGISIAIAALALTACGGGGSSSAGGAGVVVGGTTGGTTGGSTGGGGGVVGGGGSVFTFDTGIGGSGGLIGEIDGFGSIIVNGLEMETDSTDFYIEGASGSESDLHEGQFVVVAGDLGGLDADEVYYRSNLKGPVSAAPVVIDALTGRYQLTVLGQTVLTSASTRLDGVLAANIAEGDLLEVSGPIDGAGQVIATYIERKSTLTEYKAIGFVANLDASAQTFELGGLAVDYGQRPAGLSEFEGASLANGQLVEVRLATADFNAPGTAIASEVELLPVPVIEEGAEVEIEGYIDRFVSTADFSVSGVAVTSNTSTTFEDGSSASLGLNVKVEVEGTANANGVIVAETIEFKSDNAIRVQGLVTGVTTADGISGTVDTELAVTFEVRASTEIEDESSASSGAFTLNDLMIGDYIEVRGFLEGSSVIAVELERDDFRSRALIRGPLTAFSQAASTVEIQSVTVVDSAGATEYEDENENPILDRNAFYNLLQVGNPVKAEWDDFTTLADPADQLSLEDDD